MSKTRTIETGVSEEVAPGVWRPAMPVPCPCWRCRWSRFVDRLYWRLVMRGWRFHE